MRNSSMVARYCKNGKYSCIKTNIHNIIWNEPKMWNVKGNANLLNNILFVLVASLELSKLSSHHRTIRVWFLWRECCIGQCPGVGLIYSKPQISVEKDSSNFQTDNTISSPMSGVEKLNQRIHSFTTLVTTDVSEEKPLTYCLTITLVL